MVLCHDSPFVASRGSGWNNVKCRSRDSLSFGLKILVDSGKLGTNVLLIMLTIGLILTGSGILLYYTATVSSVTEKLPVGGTDIWAGPFQRANVTASWFTVSIVRKTITIEVEFGFPQYHTMHFYTVVPFKVLNIDEYVVWNSGIFRPTENTTKRIGTVDADFHVSPANSATIINESFTPNASFFFSRLPVRLGVEMSVEQILAKSEGATETVVLTFAGQSALEDDMIPYMMADTQPVWSQPLLVFVEFPSNAFLSANSYPTPAEYFVTSDYRSVFFDLNFTYQTSHVSLAQSILCSFYYPAKEQKMQQDIFFGGLLIGLGAPVLISVLNESLRSARWLDGNKSKTQNPGDTSSIEIVAALVCLVAIVVWTASSRSRKGKEHSTH